MHEYITMPRFIIWPSLQESIILQMQDFLPVMNFSFHTGISTIILQSKGKQIFGKCFYHSVLVYTLLTIGSLDHVPQNHLKLCNLSHAMLRNVIELIFDVLKHQF